MENFIFCAVFIDFVQFSVYSMCDSRMCILKFITCDRLTHIRHRFPYMGHMGKIYLEMGIFPPANSVFKLKRVKKSSFFSSSFSLSKEYSNRNFPQWYNHSVTIVFEKVNTRIKLFFDSFPDCFLLFFNQ